MPRLPSFRFTLSPSNVPADNGIALQPTCVDVVADPTSPPESARTSGLHESNQLESDDGDLIDVLRSLALDVTTEYISSTRQGKRLFDCFQPEKAVKKGDNHVVVSFTLIDPYAESMPVQDQEEFLVKYSTAQHYRQKINVDSSFTKRYRMSRLYYKHAKELRNASVKLSNKAKFAPIVAKMAANVSSPVEYQSLGASAPDIVDLDDPFRDPSLRSRDSLVLTATATIVSHDDTSERRFSLGSVSTSETLDAV